ncbi:MAG: hypothetical protein ACLTH6_03695 [Dorea longicatena]
MYGMNMQFRVTTSPSIIRIITMRLADLPEKYYHISIDRLHEAYFKQFYPEFTHRGFLPLRKQIGRIM